MSRKLHLLQGRSRRSRPPQRRGLQFAIVLLSSVCLASLGMGGFCGGMKPSLRRRTKQTVQRVATQTPTTLAQESLQGRLKRAFEAALLQVSEESSTSEDRVAQVSAADPRFGDYQCNNAMGMFKRQKREAGTAPQWKSPKDVGDAIAAALPKESSDLIESVTVAPQGFITVQLKQHWLEAEVRRLFAEGLRVEAPGAKQRIVIDYSSPNIAKEMHVGHLRSTILGHTVANLLHLLGHEVIRLNHVGDWGTQFGMLLEYMRRSDATGVDGQGGALQVSDLQSFYRSAKEAFDRDDGFRKAAQGNVVALQSGEAWAKQAWTQICDASRKEFEEIYRRLGISGLVERGESFYNSMLPKVVEELTKAGIVEESDGAQCIFTKVSDAPLIIRKADGGFGYDSTDVAAVQQRLSEERADRVVYVIDNGQEQHMQMVFEAADRAGWLKGGARLDFMGFGLVQGEDGKKFKTRSGEVVRLRDLLDEAASRAQLELARRAGEEGATGGAADGGDAELQKADAERIGVAAVKYFDLRQNRNSDYRFSYDAMLDPKGNTAVYVLYAYARVAGLFRKSKLDVARLDPAKLQLRTASERALALRLLRLPEVLFQVEDDLMPHRLIDYLYGISTDFTAFYTECPVLGTDEEESRLLLCEVTRRVMHLCLGLFGVEPLDRL